MAVGPSISYRVVDNNDVTLALTGNETILIKGYSHAEVNMGASSTSGAAIDLDSFAISNGGRSISSYKGVFPNVRDATFTFSAKDSNGNIGTATYTAPMVEYEPVTCEISNNKPNGSGNMTFECSGSWFNNTFGAAYNSLSVMYRYAELGTNAFTAWVSVDRISKVGNTYIASANLSGLEYNKAYVFEAQATDLLSSTSATNAGVKGAPVFHWSNNDVTFEVPVTFNKNVLFDADLAEFTGTNVFSGVAVFSGGTTGIQYSQIQGIECIDWTPQLYGEENYIYNSREGWAFKIGNVATVGFYIKAQYFSTTSSPIVIYGCPYEVRQASAGGGMCSNAVVSAGKNFQCFVVENHETYGDKVITTRVQDCDRPNQTELTTSGSGCYSPMRMGVLTISGTITYLTD